MQRSILIPLTLALGCWCINLSASFVVQAIHEAFSSSLATVQNAPANNTLSDDQASTIGTTALIAATATLTCVIGCGLTILIKRYCCPSAKCPEACRPRCGKCKRKKQATVVLQRSSLSIKSSSGPHTKTRISNTHSSTPQAQTVLQQPESIYIPTLAFSAIPDHPFLDPKSLTTVQEAPTSQTAQTQPPKASYRASAILTSQPNSLERQKNNESTILSDTAIALDPNDRLTQAALARAGLEKP